MARLAWITMLGGSAWLASAVVVNTAVGSGATISPSGIQAGRYAVTPVSGPSQLHRLGLTIQQSAMGSAGSWAPAPHFAASIAGAVRKTPSDPADPVILTGADLYRLNCRACHKADGTGAPPEINSMIDPIRSTSPLIMRQRMEAKGRPITVAFAKELASGSRQDVLDRLKNGGEKMPAFAHLSGVEVDALLAYLDLVAGVPGAEHRQIRIAQPATRVGEHLVKGTCHICHDATGPWPDPEALLEGAVPSLASLLRQRPVYDVIKKVRRGAPVIMGRSEVSYRGRMPLFDYLADGEVSAAYIYLLLYPPLSPASHARRIVATPPSQKPKSMPTR